MLLEKSPFKESVVMRRPVFTLAACSVVALLAVDSVTCDLRNFLSAALGASITTQAQLRVKTQKDLDVEIKDAPWPLHVIDDTSRRADGVKRADVNGDGLMDITTGCNIESKQA